MVSGNVALTDGVFGWTQEIWSRPAEVRSVYSEVAEVRWLDNNTLGYVSLEELDGGNQ